MSKLQYYTNTYFENPKLESTVLMNIEKKSPSTLVAKHEATIVRFDGFKSKISRPNHEKDIIFSQLLTKDSRKRIERCKASLDKLKSMGESIQNSNNFLIKD